MGGVVRGVVGQRRGDVPVHVLEELWVRLQVAGRIRVKDALRLGDLGVPPFAASKVMLTNAEGFVQAVGFPGEEEPVVASRVLAAFEAAYGNRTNLRDDPRFSASSTGRGGETGG